MYIYIYTSVAVLLKLGLRWGSTMCVLAMSFSFVYYPLLLFFFAISIALPLFALYFAPGRGCFIAATLRLLSTATMTTAMRTMWTILFFLSALRTATMGISAFGTVSTTAISAIALAIICCRDFLWVFALFFSSVAMRHAIPILGAKLLTAMCLIVGILWKIPATADYVDRVIAGFLFFLLDALQGHVRCATAIGKVAGGISKFILVAMQKATCTMIYQLLAVLGLMVFFTYITLATIFVVCANMIAYENLLYLPPIAYENLLYIYIACYRLRGSSLYMDSRYLCLL